MQVIGLQAAAATQLLQLMHDVLVAHDALLRATVSAGWLR
jgi:hypothetical protein